MAERVDTDLISVIEAVVAELRTALGLTARTCFLWIERSDDQFPPIPGSFGVTVSPDSGAFDQELIRGGGEHQFTVETNLLVTVHSSVMLDSGGRDELAIKTADRGVLDAISKIIVALADFDPEVGSPPAPCLRELMAPQGFSAPRRGQGEDGRWTQMSVVFPISFDWNIEHETPTTTSAGTSTTTTAGP